MKNLARVNYAHTRQKIGMLNKNLEKAYYSTTYKLLEHSELSLRVGEKNQELEKLYQDFNVNSCAFVTAWNPYSTPLGTDENQSLNEKLRSWISGQQLVSFRGIGEGDDDQWPGEESFLILGLTRELTSELGKMFHQNAVIWAGPSAIPELVVCV